MELAAFFNQCIGAAAWTDGGCRGNPGPAGYGVYIQYGGQEICLKGVLSRPASNNEAEYAGLIACLHWAVRERVSLITIYMDSELVVRQMHGLYAVNQKLRPCYQAAVALLLQLPSVSLQHIHREYNTYADRLATEAMDEAGFPRQLKIRTL